MPLRDVAARYLFPARAGVIPGATRKTKVTKPIPRTRGGDPMRNVGGIAQTEIFPARAGVDRSAKS